MSQTTLLRKQTGLRQFWLMTAFAAVIVILYALLYTEAPFTEFWNNLLSNLVVIFAAGLGTFFAARAFLHYDPSDPPRRLWMNFAIGLALWTVGESIWTVYNMRYGEVGITIADFFWFSAYIFFAHAVYLQYQIIYRPPAQTNRRWVLIWAAFTFALTLLIAGLLVKFIEEEWGLPLLIYSFYPAADLTISIAALRVVRSFRSGALGYPWLGLFAFAIVDMIYAVLELGGFYSWSVEAGNWWSAAADVMYLAAYLIVALGCYSQLLLLEHGPIFTAKRRKRINI